MDFSNSSISSWRTRRVRRWTSIAAGVAGSLALASPASAAVAPGHAITMFHNSDFVAVAGYDGADSLTIEVLRNGVTIGTATGPPQETPEGAGLEVNHGPAGAPVPGDCWDGVTPDILPGDEIRVTSRGPLGLVIEVPDTTTVGDVEFNGDAPREDPAGSGNVVVEGTGAAAADLAGEVRIGSAFRAFPTSVDNVPAGSTSWRATYSAPYDVNRNRDGVNEKQGILSGEHSMTYAPNEQEVTIAELGAGGGPGPGCEASPREANAVVASDDRFVNISSGSLVLSGTARADTAEVSVTVSSSGGGSITADATVSGGAPQRTWTVTIPRADIDRLGDGSLLVSGGYTSPDRTLTGATLRLEKDTVAPAMPTATPRAGTYSQAQSVSLNAEDGTDVRYTVDGSTPTGSSRRYSGQIQVTSSQTIRAIAVDRAGNLGAVATFAYTINVPQPPPPPAPQAAPAPAPVVSPALVVAPTPALRVSQLNGTSRVSLRKARRVGVRVSFVAGSGTKVVWVSLYKKERGGVKTLVGTKKVLVSAAGRHVVRIDSRKVRKQLGSGKYLVEVTPGRSSTDLGKSSRWSLLIG